MDELNKQKKNIKENKESRKWIICSTILFVLLAVLSVFFALREQQNREQISSNKLELEKKSNQIEKLEGIISKENELKPVAPTVDDDEGKDEEDGVEPDDTEDASGEDRENNEGKRTPSVWMFSSLRKFAKTNYVTPIKVDYTKDGKYLYVIGGAYDCPDDPNLGCMGYAGVWYRNADNTGEWKVLQSGHTIGLCSLYTSEQLDFMKKYKYIDDELSSKYLGCYEKEEGGKVFPE